MKINIRQNPFFPYLRPVKYDIMRGMKELLHIFTVFARIGVSTFGGGYSALPVMQHEMVDKEGWLTEEELTDIYALAQCMPGLIFLNCAVLSMRPRKGRAAAWAAAAGVVTPSFFIILLIAAILYQFFDLPVVVHAFNGIRVAVAATVLHSAWRLTKNGVKDPLTAVVFAAALVLLLLKVDAIPIILGGAAVALLQWYLKKRRASGKEGDA